MPKPLIVANWKLNKTIPETQKWLEAFDQGWTKYLEKVEVIICPGLIHLPSLQETIKTQKLPLKLGAQNVSQFESGKFTGEIGAFQLTEFVEYAIIGHSERREHFYETDQEVVEKTHFCIKNHITPLVCISDLSQVAVLKRAYFNAADLVIVYEPLFAIGTAHPDNPENAQRMAQEVKEQLGKEVRVLYGGSVDPENVADFVAEKDINGVLVGTASLDPTQFGRIIKNSCSTST